MNTKAAKHTLPGAWTLALVLTWAGVAGADSIVVDGVKYDDVLVYQSSSMYYVSLPREGRTLSVPTDQVDASQVTISDDPYYRDELKLRFDAAKGRADGAPPEEPTDPAFKVQAQSSTSADIDTATLLGSARRPSAKKGRSGAKIQIPREMMSKMLAGQGMTSSRAGSVETFSSADGNFSLIINGDGDLVTSLDVKVTAPPIVVQGSLSTFGLIAGSTAPWMGPWLLQNQVEILGGGSVSKTQDGVTVSVTTTLSGESLSLSLTIRGA